MARSTISIARSTPAQNPLGLARTTSIGGNFRIGGIEGRLETGMNAAQSVHHLLRPVEVFATPREIPFGGRPLGYVAQVAYLVGELDELGLAADMRRMLDLQALPFRLRQVLVVG